MTDKLDRWLDHSEQTKRDAAIDLRASLAARRYHPAEIEWQTHWQTYAVNRDYYGMHNIDDATGACVTPEHDREWSVEWNTEAEAQRIVGWTDKIDQLLRDANVNHVRLTVNVLDHLVYVNNYDNGNTIGSFVGSES